MNFLLMNKLNQNNDNTRVAVIMNINVLVFLVLRKELFQVFNYKICIPALSETQVTPSHSYMFDHE